MAKNKNELYKVEQSYSSDCFMGGDTTYQIINLDTGYSIGSFVRDESKHDSDDVRTVEVQGNKVIVKNRDGTNRHYTIIDNELTLDED